MEVVEETWYKELNDLDTFYMNVTAIKILDYITKLCSRLHTFNAVNIPQLMKTLFTDANGIPQFVDAIEAVQRKSKR